MLSVVPREYPILKCLCGKVTTFTCGELWPEITLTRCTEPLCCCEPLCKSHRHAPGTMGYPAEMRGATTYGGDIPNGDGFWEWLKSKCRTLFWSDLHKAQATYEEICANFSPPAPWPYVQLHIGRHVFESDGPNGMKPVKYGTTKILTPRSFP